MFSSSYPYSGNLNAALQIGDKHRVTTPVNWKKGEDVIVHPTVKNEEAKTLFPEFTQHLVSQLPLPILGELTQHAALPEDNTPQGGLRK